jgi:serine/threonine protein kinase/tetratricopeptide (TPR) repeat protein
MDEPIVESTPSPEHSGDAASVVAALSDAPERVRLVPDAFIPGSRYRIVGWLGEGAMGTVYEARHADIDRVVAIKVLHPEHTADARELDRFRAEARAASNIGSPYIVDVFDFSELPDGRMFYVMERLRGRGLDGEVADGPMPAGRLVGILRQICKGMASAHDAGVVHRDLKPGNVILLDPRERDAQGRSDRVKLLDFGIAAMMGQRADVLGTPAYMAPEQLRKQGVGAAIDVYALGCAAYELLCGEPPFVGSVKEVLRQHLNSVPVPPSVRANVSVPPAIERVVMRCLAKTPDERYADMRDLEAALCEAQLEARLVTTWDDLPVPDVADERRRKLVAKFASLARASPKRRRRATILAAAVLVIGLGVGTSIMRAQAEPAVPEVVTTLSREARDAAAAARFVYPPPDAPEATTAYGKVLELESLDSEERDPGRSEARSLREEFARTLVALGDRYWAIDGGRPFAIDYYAQAMLFDEANSRAHERGGLTPGQLADLQRKAETSAFSPVELEAAEPLAIMVEPDEQRRAQRLASFQDREAPRSVVADARLDALAPRKAKRVERAPQPEPRPESPAPAQSSAAKDAPPSAAKTPTKPPPTATTDRARALELAREGRRALDEGDWRRAEPLFHAALESDHRCASASIGLSDLHFDRSEYAKAVRFAERAVAAAPSHGSYHIKLGDAYFRQLRYADARSAYKRARELGTKGAAERLQRLAATTGKGE